MATYRHDAAFTGTDGVQMPVNNNHTYTLDGIFRPSQSLSVQGMASVSADSRLGNGIAAQAWAGYSNNLMYVGWLGYYVNNYHPGMGLERFGRDYFFNSPAIDFDLRPAWLPKNIRRLLPKVFAGVFHEADLGGIISANVNIVPVEAEFQNGAILWYSFIPNWQTLGFTERFAGIEVGEGHYQYLRHRLALSSDQSAKLGGRASYAFGGYFNGKLQTFNLTARFAPVPQAELSVSYELNRIRGLGAERRDIDTHLLGLNGRFALNPRLQLIGFYQKVSLTGQDIWNVRLSWEYRPLSFLYVVFNSNSYQDSPDPQSRLTQQQGIAKITYLKQF